jgi:transcriptional regulator with XRE-family HTH domain
MSIVDDLHKAIESSKLSGNELAKRAGVSQSQVSYFMRGERGIALDVAAKLANVLKLKLRPSRPRISPARSK